jgi:hypothetical protein
MYYIIFFPTTDFRRLRLQVQQHAYTNVEWSFRYKTQTLLVIRSLRYKPQLLRNYIPSGKVLNVLAFDDVRRNGYRLLAKIFSEVIDGVRIV